MTGQRILVCSSLICGLLSAQVDTGTIAGTVRDSSGGVLAKARVVVENLGTGHVIELATNEQGIYVSPPLRPGDYTVRVEAAGFERSAKRLPLDVSQRAVVDFELKVGAVTQEITVQEIAAILQTETSTLSNLRPERAIKDLPLNGRNFAQLLQLSAGVMPAQTQQAGSPITMKRGVTGNSVNGMRLEENNFLVDGVSNVENHNGLGILIFPSIDAIAEFRVESSVPDAQFGRGGGGTVNLTYKSGTAELHGGLYEFLRNANLDAKNFFDRPGEKIPPFKQNQFGGFLGGPLPAWRREKRVFFFANYEGARVRQAQTLISSVPTEAFRQGDFSAQAPRIFDPLTQRPTPTGQFTRDPFPGNRIPANRADQVGRNILGLYPPPNLGAGAANNFLFNPVRSITGDKLDLKFDVVGSERDTGFVRYSYGDDDLIEPSFLPAPAVGNGPGVPGPADQPVNQIVISETHIFSPARSNEFRAGWTRLNLRAFNPNFGRNVAEEVGVPGGNVPGDLLTSGSPIFNVAGFRALGDNGFSPAVVVSDNLQWSDNFNYVRGRHTIKSGGEVQRRRYNAFQSNVLRGVMSFGTAYSQDPAAPGTGFGPADALLGRPLSGDIRFLNGTRGFRRTELALYAQDIYKVTERLTLNFGLRWEDFVGWPWTEVNNRLHQFVPELQDVRRVGADPVPWRSGVRGDHNNFSPRVGLAYRLWARTVFRAGHGLYYSAPQWDVTRNLAANPPEFIVFSFTNNQFDFSGARPASRGFDRPAQGTVAGTLRAIETGARTPYTQQWNAALQQELPAALSLTVAYVGTRGTKLQGFPNINQAVPGTGPVAARRPFPRFDDISGIQNRFNSFYHGLQVTAERRFTRGSGFLAAYTYSHSIDETDQFGGVMDIRNIRLDRGNAGFDVRHRLVASWIYELPLRASGPRRHLVEGWQVNGILSLYGGLPFSVGSSTNTLNIGQGTRADRLRDGNLPPGQRTLERWFDTGAFAAPGFQLFGNSGRNILWGPGTRQVDLSIFKEFYFRENRDRRVEFRSEFFNFTNTPQFNNPNATLGTPGFGTVSSAGSPLTLQRTPRHIQFGLKLYF